MGKSNKERRAAKSKAKAKARSHQSGADGRSTGRSGGPGPRSRSGWSPFEDTPPFTESERARSLIAAIVQADEGDGFAPEAVTALLSMPAALVDRVAEEVLLELIGVMWAGGWQPSELHRQARRGCATAAPAKLLASSIAVDHAGRRAATLDPRWMAQVDNLDLPEVTGSRGWLSQWAKAEGLDRAGTLSAVVDAVSNLVRLPSLDPILPPPGTQRSHHGPAAATRPDGATGGEIDPILERIRGLLAKAESTTFEAEATALTAKAQELMTRHAIDAAMVEDRHHGEREEPVIVRLPIDAPYADAKSLLLQTVALSGRCRSVFHLRLGLSTVVGFPSDVAGVEVLFTSLLLQAQKALAEASRKAPPGTRTRGQSYRSAFLIAYTHRIGDRLEEINRHVFAEVEAELGASFLPVLRSRSDAVDDFMADRFGETVSTTVRGGYDAAGWAGGRVAADSAQLTFGDLNEPVEEVG